MASKTALAWEAIAGLTLLVGGVLLTLGLFFRWRWADKFGEPHQVSRTVGMILGIAFGALGTYLLNLVRSGLVWEKIRGLVPYR